MTATISRARAVTFTPHLTSPLCPAFSHMPHTPSRTPRPALSRTTRPALSRTPRPALSRTPRPALSRTTRPALSRTPRPALSRTTRPALSRTPRPALTVSTPEPAQGGQCSLSGQQQLRQPLPLCGQLLTIKRLRLRLRQRRGGQPVAQGPWRVRAADLLVSAGRQSTSSV